MSSQPPPVSLGKPSLRYRLESYYSLVAPNAIADKEDWKRKFEIIYEKFGGSVEGETKLSAKLAKKYGNHVRLLVAPPPRSMRKNYRQIEVQNHKSSLKRHDEQYYENDETRKGSKIVDFTSPRFDALHALRSKENAVLHANPSIFTGSTGNQKLDNVAKFRTMLPECDPQWLEPSSMSGKKSQKKNSLPAQSSADDPKKKKIPMFLSMVSRYENSGPLSLLYSIVANRQRARVMVRYVDCIRGTLTGYLIAFDKHFNMILRDVDEVYSGRVTRHAEAVEFASAQTSNEPETKHAASSDSKNLAADESLYSQIHAKSPSKATIEAQRRRCYPPDGSGGPGPAIKQRYFHQMIVRGDNVVMVWRAEAERSAHPHTNKSPSCSMYGDKANSESKEQRDKSENNESRIGTPGSLFYALQRWEKQHGQRSSFPNQRMSK